MKRLIIKHIETLKYIFFGALTTGLNIVLYHLFQGWFGYSAANGWANVLNNAICILFAYWTNRTWVFMSKKHGMDIWKEFLAFGGSRLGTMAIDSLFMIVLGNVIGGRFIPIDWLDLWGVTVKVVSNIVVIVLNYILAKAVFFHK